MHVIAINGSPRKNWNTAKALQKALEGAASKGATTELIHLYDLNYKGCIGCLACKAPSGKSFGQCIVHDELRPLLQRIEQADALILGSPIYYGMVTGEMRSFMERLLFQYLIYDATYSSSRKKRIPVGMLYTMNVDQNGLDARGYKQVFTTMEAAIKRILSDRDIMSLYVTDTCQTDDYAHYNITAFNAEHKQARKALSVELTQAFELGLKLCS